MHTLVIAEMGSCHDGDLGKALRLINAAADAGADAVKVQFWSDPDALADRRRVPPTYRAIYARYRLPASWLPDIRRQCAKRRIGLAATTYLPQDVATIAQYVDYFKIASFEAEARDLLQAHLPFIGPRPLIISLGMGATRTLMFGFSDHVRRRAGGDLHVSFLHCVSAYPAPVDALNLCRFWRKTDAHRPEFDGLSDHTDPAFTWTGALAVAAGARIIEAHLRLIETQDENPDAPHAMHPAQFREYVRHIRFSESCVGKPTVGAVPCEEPMAAYRVRTP